MPSDVAVTCENGTVFLTGRLGSLEEIDRAIAIARSVAGVSAVEARLFGRSREDPAVAAG